MATSAGSVTGTRGAFLVAHTHLAADRPAGLVIRDRLYSTASHTPPKRGDVHTAGYSVGASDPGSSLVGSGTRSAELGRPGGAQKGKKGG